MNKMDAEIFLSYLLGYQRLGHFSPTEDGGTKKMWLAIMGMHDTLKIHLELVD